jgi:GT2 family glycosyltransferase
MIQLPLVSLSVVSHGQAHLVAQLLGDLERLPRRDFEVVITSNVAESTAAYEGWSYPVRILTNNVPKGFGANHNAAFAQSRGQFFAVVNPDIRIPLLDLNAVLQPFEQGRVGAVAPLILSPEGEVEDSARHFPTIFRLIRRQLGRQRGPDYQWGTQPIAVDWVAGMFVMFRPQAFRELNGFDDKRFFMYMEDVDICERLGNQGWSVLLQPRTSVVHAAQRASHRNMKHLRWHIVSAFRYLTSL